MSPDKNQPTHWHTLETDKTLETLQSRSSGLSASEASERLKQYGPNRLTPPKQQSPLMRFLRQFHNVLIYVLLGAGVVTAALQHWVDSGVIVAVVVINAIIGFIQEGKAEKALEAIRNMLSLEALVKRDGKSIMLPADQLVPGDIVLLQSGDKVPADLRLLNNKELRIDEAMLTGESVPAEKSTQTVAENAVVGDRKCIAYSGTLVTYGQASGVVVATADQTEIGRISALLSHVQTLTTPLLRQMAVFGKWLTIAILMIATITAAYGITVWNYTAAEMFLAAVGLAVAAIPEGLPAIMTITLAIGVQRMARRHAIIRRLPAVETLGSVTVVCSDKTGTLTRNEMTVQSVATSTGLFDVSGEGYNPHGFFMLDGEEINIKDYPILDELTRAATLCNDAAVENVDGRWLMRGDPTEGALITLGLKTGTDLKLQQEEWPRTDIIPFESEHRFMATMHHDHAGHGFIYIKGAPERILTMCAHQRMRGEDYPLDARYWESQAEAIASRGHRLLAIAFKNATDHHRELKFSDVETGLTLLGVVGIIDPPRTEAIHAVAHCRTAGIRVKMITGDHATTAVAIGKQMGIGDGQHVITGVELDTLDERQLAQKIEQTDVFARTSPEHKLRLVQALQAKGHVVAMTGDGVNDAPALKRADVGIAMGQKGTEVSKEAAEMVLADDNFASIASAIEEGRTVYDNLKKAILFILPTNGGEALTLITAILLGRALPITPAQILWVNMITAVTLALALAFEPSERNVMRRPPRDPSSPILSPMLIWRVLFVSTIIVIGTFGLFIYFRNAGASLEYARTVSVNTLVMFEIFYIFSTRYLLEPVLNREGLLGNRYVLWAIGILLIMQLLFTYAGPAQALFGTTGLELSSWLLISAVASSVLILVEIEKIIIRHRMKQSATNYTSKSYTQN